MRTRRSSGREKAVIATVLLFAVIVLCLRLGIWPRATYHASHHHGQSEAVLNSLSLDDAQCKEAFPALTKEIDIAVSQGMFDLHFSRAAVLNAKVEDGMLFILHKPVKGELSDMMHQRQIASLHQLHQAIVTSPSPLPNTSLTLAIHDIPLPNTLSFARRGVSSSPTHIFPMPHFSFWSWPLPFIGSIASAARAITSLEADTSFAEKDPRPVWRGTSWYNNGAGSNPRLRQDLLAKTKDAKWADVQALDWNANSQDAGNALRIEDFCLYRYIIHTEGVGYSGRLQFHQLCESVVLSPPLEWMQHTSHFIKPVFSSELLSPSASQTYPSARAQEAWPHGYPADEANMAFINPDWSDLEATVAWLEEHPVVAAGIARRQRELYAERGYLGPAAEMCYWRALIKGWSEVARPVGEEWGGDAVPFQTFVVTED